LERDNWKITQIKRTAQITHTDVQRRGYGMVADVGRVMTSSAGAGYGGKMEVVVEPGDAGDGNRLRIEQGLPPDDTGAPALRIAGPSVVVFVFPRIRPGIEEGENDGCECRAGR